MSEDFLDRIIDEQKEQSEPDPQETAQPSEPEATPTEGEAEPEPEVVAYTPEEIEELIKADGQVDFRRLSPEGQAIWKSVDRGFKPKLEERARLKEEVERIRQYQAQVQQPKAAPANIYEAFVRDPVGVMRDVRNALYQAKLKDPFSEDVTKLEMLRDDLMDKRSEIERTSLQARTIADEVVREVTSAIPDYNTKREKLEDFAEQLGFSRNELAYITNPLVFGNLATKFTLAVNKLYDQMNTADLKKKEVKRSIQVEKAGTGFDTKKEQPWSEKDYLAVRQKSLLS